MSTQVCSGSGLRSALYTGAFGLGIYYGRHRVRSLRMEKERQHEEERAKFRKEIADLRVSIGMKWEAYS